MAAENDATFTEVLEVKVNPDQFQSGLNSLLDLYAKFKEKLGSDNAQFLNTAALSGLVQQFEKGLAGVDELVQQTFQTVQNVQLEIAKFLDKIDAQEETQTNSKLARIKKAAEEEVATAVSTGKIIIQNAEELAAVLAKFEGRGNVRGPFESNTNPKPGVQQDITIEQQGLADKAHAETIKAFEKDAVEFAKLEVQKNAQYEKDFAALVKQEALQQQLYDQEYAALVKIDELNRLTTERIASSLQQRLTEENQLAESEFIAQEKIYQAKQASVELDAKQIQILRDELAAMDAIAARLNSQRTRNGDEQLEAAQIAATRENSERQEASAARQIKLQEDLFTAKQRTIELETKAQIAGSATADERKLQIASALEQSTLRLVAARQQLSAAESKPDTTDQERIELVGKYNAELTKTISLQNSLRSATAASDKESQGFFDRLFSNAALGFANLAKIQVEWQLIGAAIQAVTALVEAPFKAIADGLTHLREVETAASNLTGVLATNVKFSGDFADNFKQAQVASRGLVDLIQERAVAIGVPFDLLNKTVTELVNAGLTPMAGSLRNVVSLAETFQLSIRNAGSGLLDSKVPLAEIEKLYQGVVPAGNKFLTQLGLSNAEWVKIRDAAKEHGDLLQRLAPYLANYTAAVDDAQGSQKVLLEDLDLLVKRIEAAAAKELFTQISAGLRELKQFLEDNRETIILWAKTFVTSLTEIVTAFAGFANATGLTYVLVGAFKALALGLVFAKEAAVELALSLELAFKLAANNGNVAKATRDIDNYRAAIQKSSQETATFANKLLGLRQGSLGTGAEDGSSDVNINPLDQQLGGKTPPPPAVSQLSSINKDFALEREKFFDSIDQIKQAFAEKRDAIKQAEADQLISRREAATQGKALDQLELDQVNQQKQKLNAIEVEFANKIDNDPATGDKKASAQAEFQKQVIAADRQVAKLKADIAKQDRTDERAATAEDLKFKEDALKAEADLNAREIVNKSALLSEAHTQGILTDRQFFEAEVVLSERAFQERVDNVNKQLALFKGNVVKRQQLNEQLEKDDKNHNDLLNLQSLQRQRIDDEEFQKKLANQQAGRAQLLEQAQTQANLQENVQPSVGLSAALDAVNRARELELDQLVQEKIQLLAISEAKNKESEETRKLTLDLQALENQREQALANRIATINRTTPGANARGVLIGNEINNQRNALTDRQATLQNALPQAQALALISPAFKPVADAMALELKQLTLELNRLNVTAANATPTLSKAFSNAAGGLFGANNVTAFNQATDPLTKLGIGADAAAHALGQIVNVVNQVQQGVQQGGVLGGAGAAISGISGVLGSDLLKKIPIIGEFLPAIGQVLTIVGSLFTASAKRIAEDVKKSFADTVDKFNNGNSTLVDTINTLEAERNSAIVRLSGTKGGKDQLDKILPDFDKEIASLQKTQAQITTDFQTSLDALRLNSSTLTDVANKWAAINKQVKEYIGAGGDAAKAAEFLSLNLKNIQTQATQELAQAEQDAIKDAQHLNDLLSQRNQLNDDFEKQQFDLINQDAIERRQAGAVTRGKELADLKSKHQQELDNLDAEIALTNQKVDKETQVFKLATDAAELRRRDEELTLAALDVQIQKYKDLQTIIAGISLGSDGSVVGNGGLFIAPGAIQITIVQSPSTPDTGLGDTIGVELLNRLRQVPG